MMSQRGCFAFIVSVTLFTTAMLTIALFHVVKPIFHTSVYDSAIREDMLARMEERMKQNNFTIDALAGKQFLDDMANGIAYLTSELHKVSERLQMQQQQLPKDQNRRQDESPKYIASDFFAVHAGGGVGNILFEFISIIGIARSVGRQPYIDATNYQTLSKLHDLDPIFPNLAKQFLIRFANIPRITVTMAAGKCCVYNGIGEIIQHSDAADILVKDNYLQSFKYFQQFSNEIRSSILFISESVSTIGRNKLLTGDSLNAEHHRLCVHIRRGDFVNSALHMESREEFTVWAVRHIINEKLSGRITNVILFGNDRNWSLNLTRKYFNDTQIHGYVTETIPNSTPVVDFAFTSHNCDSIILTASASTFGWWSAFIAGPQKHIYYNSVYSKPNGIEKEFNAADFFPPEWISLTMPSDFKLPSS